MCTHKGAAMMHPWISYVPWRRQEWKGHDTKEGVRRAISYHEGSHFPLRIFAEGTSDGYPAYHEVPAESWDTAFAKDEEA